MWKPNTFLCRWKCWLLLENHVPPQMEDRIGRDSEVLLIWDFYSVCRLTTKRDFVSLKAFPFCLGPQSVPFVFESLLSSMVQIWSFSKISEIKHHLNKWKSLRLIYGLLPFSSLRQDTQRPQLKQGVCLGSHFRSFSWCSASLNAKTAWWKGLGRGKLLASWLPRSREGKSHGRRAPPFRSHPQGPPLLPRPGLLTANQLYHPKIQSASKCPACRCMRPLEDILI